MGRAQNDHYLITTSRNVLWAKHNDHLVAHVACSMIQGDVLQIQSLSAHTSVSARVSQYQFPHTPSRAGLSAHVSQSQREHSRTRAPAPLMLHMSVSARAQAVSSRADTLMLSCCDTSEHTALLVNHVVAFVHGLISSCSSAHEQRSQHVRVRRESGWLRAVSRACCVSPSADSTRASR